MIFYTHVHLHGISLVKVEFFDFKHTRPSAALQRTEKMYNINRVLLQQNCKNFKLQVDLFINSKWLATLREYID